MHTLLRYTVSYLFMDTCVCSLCLTRLYVSSGYSVSFYSRICRWNMPPGLWLWRLCVKWITQWHLHQTPMVFTSLSGLGHAPLSDLNLLPVIMWRCNVCVFFCSGDYLEFLDQQNWLLCMLFTCVILVCACICYLVRLLRWPLCS